MIRFDRRLVMVAAISSFALFGCNQPQNTASNPTGSAPEAPSAQTTAQDPAQNTAQSSANPNFEGLRTVISNTKTAVNAGDFQKAQSDFSQLEEHWSKVEDGVQAKSSDTYNAIEDTTDQVNNGLKASQPSKDQVLASLNSLESSVNTAAKL